MYREQNKVAIVYDWRDKWGGVERALLHLHTLFPKADFFTSAVELKNAQWARNLTIHTSFLQVLPSWLRSQRALLMPLFPLAFESFRFDEYSLVISVTSSFAKGIVTKPDTKHICYLLTPPRYLWSHTKEYLPGIMGRLTKPAVNHIREWDKFAAYRPDGYISISHTTAHRAKQYYQIESPVIYPPFDSAYWDEKITHMKKPQSKTVPKSYYLWVGRMEQYKKPELIIEFAKLKPATHFIFVGTGSLEQKLKNNTPKNCQFLGLVSDDELSYLYSHAKALIMPQNEDFGYISLEAQYHGCPVVAFRAGGACETVREGKTGIFFDEQTVASLSVQLERFEQISYNLSHSTQLERGFIREKYGLHRFNTQFNYQLKQFISL